MTSKSGLLSLFCGAVCLLSVQSNAAVEAVKSERGFELRGGNGEVYVFNSSAPHNLIYSEFKGKKGFLKTNELTCRTFDDNWLFEMSSPGRKHSCEIKNTGDTAIFRSTASWGNISLEKIYTLRDGSPALEAAGTLTVSGEKNKIEWYNLFNTSIPVKDRFLVLTSVVQNGVITPSLRVMDNPVLDGKGKCYFPGFSGIPELFAAGSYDPERKTGMLVMSLWGKDVQPLRLTSQPGKATAGIAVSPRTFNRTSPGKFVSRSGAVFYPFDGDPSQLNDKVIPDFVRELKSRHLIASYFDTGKRLPGFPGGKWWQDLPESKIFRDSPDPSGRATQVELFLARDEAESVQLAIRPDMDLTDVSLRILGFDGKGLPVTAGWNPVGFVNRENIIGYFAAVTGEVPDALLKERTLNCPADKVQPFLVTFKAMDNAKPGVYEGQIDLFAGEKIIASCPVILNVGNFSIAKRNLTVALDVWDRPKAPAGKRQSMLDEMDHMIIETRAGRRWVRDVYPKWDSNNRMLPVDYSRFDRGFEAFLAKYKPHVVVLNVFKLGWGMEPRDTAFGKKSETLSPKWKKRVQEFAADFRDHLRGKGWSNMVVMDLYDEPKDRDLHLLTDTIPILREIAPEWRYTYAGDYREELKGLIDFWNHGMSRAFMFYLDEMRKAGGEVSVYNPNGFSDNGLGTYQRGSMLWLWHRNIRYVYQWTVNCWGELGNGGWDYYRDASWIVPGQHGPLRSLRLEAVRNGIEDYEYMARLKEFADSAPPEIAAAARKLMRKAENLARLPENGGITVIVNLDPKAFDDWHREAWDLLNKQATAKK